MIKVPFGAQYFVGYNGNVVEYYKVSSTGVILTVRAPNPLCGEQYPYWSVSTYPDKSTLTEAFGSGLKVISELDKHGEWSYLNE